MTFPTTDLITPWDPTETSSSTLNYLDYLVIILKKAWNGSHKSDQWQYGLHPDNKCTFRFEAILKVALNQCKVTVGYISNSKAININSRCPRCIFRNEGGVFLPLIFRNEHAKAINKATKYHLSWSFCKTSAFWVPVVCIVWREVHNISD